MSRNVLTWGRIYGIVDAVTLAYASQRRGRHDEMLTSHHPRNYSGQLIKIGECARQLIAMLCNLLTQHAGDWLMTLRSNAPTVMSPHLSSIGEIGTRRQDNLAKVFAGIDQLVGAASIGKRKRLIDNWLDSAALDMRPDQALQFVDDGRLVCRGA